MTCTRRPPARHDRLAVAERGLHITAVAAGGGARCVGVSLRRHLAGDHGPTGAGPDRPAVLRAALESLGPTFTKLGQSLAGRADLVPEAYRHELAHLRDDTRPMPPGLAVQLLEAAYGRPVTEVFAELSPRPVAAASIGQVHTATLLDGRRVAVKIRRPGTAALIDADLAVLSAATGVVERLFPRTRPLHLTDNVEHFASALRDETDYRLEARHLRSARAALAGLDWVSVPEPVTEWCRPGVLVMEAVDGTPLTDPERVVASAGDRDRLAVRILAANLRLILFNDVFQADPHPGNFLLTGDGGLAMLDFGQVGHSSEATRAGLATLLTGLVGRTPALVATAVEALFGGRVDDPLALGRAVTALVGGLLDRPLEDVRIGPLLVGTLGVITSSGLAVPPDLGLLVKAVVECEATAHELSPRVHLADVIGLVAGPARPGLPVAAGRAS